MAAANAMSREHRLNGRLVGLNRDPVKNRRQIIETRLDIAVERARIATAHAAEQTALAVELREELEALGADKTRTLSSENGGKRRRGKAAA